MKITKEVLGKEITALDSYFEGKGITPNEAMIIASSYVNVKIVIQTTKGGF